MLDVKILTAYPEMFPGSLEHSLIGKALKENIFKISTIDLHQFGIDERMSIDDEPFGGGPGMVLRPDVVEKALNSIPKTHNICLLYTSPSPRDLSTSRMPSSA